jgi:hypothetical protein
MDAPTPSSGSFSPNGNEATPVLAATEEPIERVRTAEQSRRAAALAELAERQNELGLTE